VLLDQDVAQIERLVRSALAEPDQLAAIRICQKVLGTLDAPPHMRLEAGLCNVGLLATQELRSGLPQRSDWAAAQIAGRSLLSLRGRRLAEGLGFRIEQHTNHVHLLKVNGHSRAAAVFCNDDEPFDAPAKRFDGITPVSLALTHADIHGADWVVLTRSSEIRLYAARTDTGVGRKGRAETFVEANLALLAEQQAGYLHLLFSAAALDTNGTIEEVLENSDRFAADLAVRLRERVYDRTVPALADAVAARIGHAPTPQDLRAAYEQVMTILFRLLFVAYAEARDLFPYRANTRYTDHSLTRIVTRLADDRRTGKAIYDTNATSMWADIRSLWAAIDTGNVAWGLPAYNGGLFSRDLEVSATGAAIKKMAPLTDAELAPALSSMLIDHSPEGEGPVDFRSLSVRTFGTIYEGLLESQLSLAEQDLALRQLKDGATYVPASTDEPVEVTAGSVYFHNRSGVRKSTGSYFTKEFAVKHLLDHALEPALDDHLARLDELASADDVAAVKEAFFDFRCADIAMGSGHFLVAAVDRIERRLTGWLATHRQAAAGVIADLDRLRDVALDGLGELASDVEMETSLLLRRQVARYCIYGVDLNRVAVELARLSIWVHTFVSGLPLSFLDHNLIEGNSLTGIGTLDEVLRVFEPDVDTNSTSFARVLLDQMLAESKGSLKRLARTADATKAEIAEAREAHNEARQDVKSAIAIFDVVSAQRAGVGNLPENFDPEVLIALADDPEVRDAVADLKPVHFPAAFAEVFLREGRSGFDCLIGNPPWEQVVVQEHAWWGLHEPGLRGLPVGQMKQRITEIRRQRPDLERSFERESELAEITRVVLRKAFPRLGSGRTDLYQVFAWANLELARHGGRVGIVVPRTALNSDGMSEWRQSVTEIADDAPPPPYSLQAAQQMSVLTLINHKGWVFDEVHNSYTVALLAVTRCSVSQPVSTRVSGPSTMSTDATQSPSLQPENSTLDPILGGGFDTSGEKSHEPYVAIYPGPASSLDHYRQLLRDGTEKVPVSEFLRWSNSAAFPQIPSRAAFRVWRKMKQHPRFDGSDLDNSSDPPPPGVVGDGSSEQCRAISTPRPTVTDSSETTDMALPSSRGTSRHPRPRTLRERRWLFRPVRELDATNDRGLFMNDDGTAARDQEQTP